MDKRKRFLNRLRQIWAFTGVGLMVVFVVWSLIAYQASTEARQALLPTDQVAITETDQYWAFSPVIDPASTAIVFIPGALVDPIAYAPLVAELAAKGYPAVLLKVPNRGAFGGGDGPEFVDQVAVAQQAMPTADTWWLVGHSRGGVLAAQLAYTGSVQVDGLALLGTSQPRDFSLASADIPILKILASRDCVSEVYKSDENRHLLPDHTRWLVIEGGNHSQFGWYGFQPGDCGAEISRQAQQDLVLEALLAAMPDQ